MVVPALIAAGASLAGGFLNSKSAEKNNAALLADKQQDRDLQMRFAQNGIQWKVADAKLAGVSPLYALGANTVSYAPSALNLSPTNPGSGIAAAGQDISRAMHATRSQSGRVDAFTKTVQDLSLQKMGLENQLLSSQIAKLNASSNPPMPSDGVKYLLPGQGNTPGFVDKPADRVPSAPGAPSQEHGAIPDVGFARTTTGWAPVPSKDVKERIEDNWIQERLYDMRNNIMPSFGGNVSPPKMDPGKGNVWWFNPFRQEYQIVRHDSVYGRVGRWQTNAPANFNERFTPRY